LQFVPVRRRPLLDRPQGRAIEIAGNNATIQVHRSGRASVMCMAARADVCPSASALSATWWRRHL